MYSTVYSTRAIFCFVVCEKKRESWYVYVWFYTIDDGITGYFFFLFFFNFITFIFIRFVHSWNDQMWKMKRSIYKLRFTLTDCSF